MRKDKKGRLLFRFECRKCFTRFTVILIFLLTLLRLGISVFQYRETREDRLYKELVSQYEGTADQTKINDIKESYEYYTWILSEFPNTQILYAEGKADKDVYQEQKEDYDHARTYISAWEHLYENAARYEQMDGRRPWFLYETAWDKLLSVSRIDFIFIIFFLAVLIPYFYYDDSSGIKCIIDRLPGYRRARKYEAALSIMAVAGVTLIWGIIDFTTAGVLSILPAQDACVYSLREYAGADMEISLRAMLFIRMFIKVIENITAVLGIFGMKMAVKNKILTTVAGAVLLTVGNSWILKLLTERAL